MLYFLVTFIVVTAINQLNPLFGPQAAIHHHPTSSYPYCGYHNTATLTMCSSFPSIGLLLDNNSMESFWHLFYIAAGHKTHQAGHMTHNAGLMTHNTGLTTHNAGLTIHNTAGHVTQHTFVSSIQCNYCLIPGCITTHPISVSKIGRAHV